MRFPVTAGLFLSLSMLASAQLTPEQKVADFTQLAGVFTKNYAPYEWKRDTGGFDLMNLEPWLDRAVKTKDDLEFMDLLIEYVARLNDGHDYLSFPSDFEAYLGFDVDIYDGTVLVDRIDRTMLPSRQYGFAVGDEVVSVDGKPAGQLLKEFAKYAIAANPRSTSRVAADAIVYRAQSVMPRAHEIGETATVVIRRASGAEETYSIPWDKYGAPILFAGGGPSPRKGKYAATASVGRNAAGFDDSLPPYMMPMMPLLHARMPRASHAIRGIGAISPVFALPTGFSQRLGKGFSDNFLSGTFTADGQKIGYLRIPDFDPASSSFALQQFETEMRYFQQNTDGLIVDVMRNPGGIVSYAEAISQRLNPQLFRTIGFEIRATSNWVAAMSAAVESARYYGDPEWVVARLEANLKDVAQAHSEYRGRTGAVSLNLTGSMDLLPASTVYSKPLMLLVDEMSASGAEAFTAAIQDNNRGAIFGYRTMGLGGTVAGFDACSYSEGYVTVTVSLMNRKYPIQTTEFPAAPYVENIGVRPDITEDYITKDNLLKSGKPFVDAFSKAMAERIKASKGN